MKKQLLFLFIALFSVFSLYAENIITLTDTTTKETAVFRKGAFMVFELKADRTVREGFIREINDSAIVFDDAQVSLSQINILAGSTRVKVTAGKVAHAFTNALIVAGSAVFNCGWGFFAYGDYYYWPIGGTIWLAGAALAGVGYAMDFACSPLENHIRVRNYRGWIPAIVKEEQPVTPAADTTKTVPPAQPVEKEKPKTKNLAGDDVYGD